MNVDPKMITPEILRSKAILIHLSALILGGVCLGLLALGVNVMIIGCAISAHVAFFSSFFALPAALIELFQSKEKSIRFRLQLGAVVIIAGVTLACGITLAILTEGRH
jgi:hypothetical protein